MNNQYIKTLLSFFIVMATISTAHAQTENTSERLIDQLKNGTAPGLLFSSEKPVANPEKDKLSELQKKESLIAQIRKGIAPNMKFQAGAGAVANTRTTAPGAALTTPKAVTKQGPLPSEMEIPKALPKTVITPVFPAQEEVAKPSPAGKQ